MDKPLKKDLKFTRQLSLETQSEIHWRIQVAQVWTFWLNWWQFCHWFSVNIFQPRLF